MANQIITLDNADNAGGDETYVQQTATTLDTSDTLFHFVNGFDQAVDVTVDGTYAQDDDFSDSVQLNTENISSDASGYYVVTEPWEQIQITLSPAADPTTGTFTAYRSDEN